MKVKCSIFQVLVSILLLSCDLATPSNEPNIPVKLSQLRKFAVSQIYYDSLRIQSLTDLTVPRKEFQRIAVGITNFGFFTELASTTPSFTGESGNYTMTFDACFKFDSTKYLLRLVVRYIYSEGSFTDIDTTVYTVSYPYQSATLFLTSSIGQFPDMYFQDVDRLGNRFFYHPIGGAGLFEYNLSTSQKRELMLYGSGDHIAADSNFVFVDIGHNSVWRYDLSKDSSKKIISLGMGVIIAGMDTYSGYLYVLHGLNFNLKKYTLDGVLVDSLQCPIGIYYMAINENIVYRVGYPDRLSRFDLSTKTMLSNIPAPMKNGDGIKFYNGSLYSIDYSKRIVGWMPAADLK